MEQGGDKLNWKVIGTGAAQLHSMPRRSNGEQVFLPEQVIQEVGRQMVRLRGAAGITNADALREAAHGLAGVAGETYVTELDGGGSSDGAAKKAIEAVQEAVRARTGAQQVA
ncbi:MAG: hypothetical protein PHI23_00925 [Candidatus Peribacteraceae bacterium]|nr:hypothetical protein [Candidatus Peribacteraceae bacterium]